MTGRPALYNKFKLKRGEGPYRKCNRCRRVALGDPQANERQELNEREHVHPHQRNVLEEHIVGLVLVGNEEQEDALEKLEALEGLDAHEEKDAEEDGLRYEAQDGRDEGGESDRQSDQHRRHPLLSYSEEVRLFSRSGRFGLLCQRLNVVDGEYGGGDKPRKTKHGLDYDYDCQYLVRNKNTSILEQT